MIFLFCSLLLKFPWWIIVISSLVVKVQTIPFVLHILPFRITHIDNLLEFITILVHYHVVRTMWTLGSMIAFWTTYLPCLYLMIAKTSWCSQFPYCWWVTLSLLDSTFVYHLPHHLFIPFWNLLHPLQNNMPDVFNVICDFKIVLQTWELRLRT
jgi:hypothetical protein